MQDAGAPSANDTGSDRRLLQDAADVGDNVRIVPAIPRRPIDRQDVILMIASGADGPYDLDPIRMMKGCFVVSQAGRSEWRSLFDFAPYDYGPFDTSVYRARDALLAKGYLQADDGGRYASYTLSEAGAARVRELERGLDEKAVRWLRRVGRYVCSKSFTHLLDDVYTRFPEYATRSVVNRP